MQLKYLLSGLHVHGRETDTHPTESGDPELREQDKRE